MSEKTMKRWRLASQILILLAGLAGILAVAKQLPPDLIGFAALAASMLGFASRWCEQQLPAARGPAKPLSSATKALLPLILGPWVIAAACTPSVAVKSAHGFMTLTQTTGETLVRVHAATPETDRGKLCSVVKRYRLFVRPAGRLSAAGALAAAKGGDLAVAAQPIACEFGRWYDVAKPELGKYVDTLGALAAPLKAFACPKGSVIPILGAVLPVAAAVVKWLMEIIGGKEAKLAAEVKAWLDVPPNDGTDGICKD